MIKTMTFAILHFATAFGVACILTGSIGIFKRSRAGRTACQHRRFLFPRTGMATLRKKYSGLTLTSTALPRLAVLSVLSAAFVAFVPDLKF